MKNSISICTTGKGSGRRPRQVPQKDYDDNWDRIFGKKKGELK